MRTISEIENQYMLSTDQISASYNMQQLMNLLAKFVDDYNERYESCIRQRNDKEKFRTWSLLVFLFFSVTYLSNLGSQLFGSNTDLDVFFIVVIVATSNHYYQTIEMKRLRISEKFCNNLANMFFELNTEAATLNAADIKKNNPDNINRYNSFVKKIAKTLGDDSSELYYTCFKHDNKFLYFLSLLLELIIQLAFITFVMVSTYKVWYFVVFDKSITFYDKILP